MITHLQEVLLTCFIFTLVVAMSTSILASRPPLLSNQTVAHLVAAHLGFTDVSETTIKTLPSYYDRNYSFQGRIKDSSSETYILKIVNPASTSYEVISGIVDILIHLYSCGFPCPKPVLHDRLMELSESELTGMCEKTTSESQTTECCEGKNTTKYPVMVLTYINGHEFDRIERKLKTPDLLHEIGQLMGKMNKELMV